MKKVRKLNEHKKLQLNLLKELNSLLESDAASAEITMAARGIVDELQDVIEKLGKIQNDQLGPLIDQMSYTHGRDQAEQFRSSVDSSISDLLDSARSAKDSVNNAVLVLTGEASPDDGMMGGDTIGGDMSDDFEDDISMDDPLGGDVSKSGPMDEPLGRAKR